MTTVAGVAKIDAADAILRAAGMSPEARYVAALRAGEMPARPNSRRFRIDGAATLARLPSNDKLVCHVLCNPPKPKSRDELAYWCGLSPAVIGRALSHLERHGWFSREPKDWTVMSGADCDCPVLARVPRVRKLSAEQVEALAGRTALYRFYGAANQLLYVGITDALGNRVRAHSADKPWWPDVTRKTVTWYDSRDQADLAETLAIAAENPIHNIAKRYTPRAETEFEL